MGFEFSAIRFGAPALAWLTAHIALARRDDPFAPVTVVVADNLTGVMARRDVAATTALVNVSFVTPANLAARLSPAARPRVSPEVLAAAARGVLADQPGDLFAPVAQHPATEAALVGAYRTLIRADPQTMAELATSPSARTRQVVALSQAISHRLVALDDEFAQSRRAAEAVRSATVDLAGVGAVIVYLVDELAPAHLGLLAAIAERCTVPVIIGATGVPSADGALAWWAHHGNDPAVESLGVAEHRPVPASVFTATDSDDEVRHVVRSICARLEAGAPLERMAIVYPQADPYARIVNEHLDAAGLAHNGPSVRRLAATVAGRAAMSFLRLADGTWTRTAVLDLAATVGGADPDGTPRAVAQWDEISRRAGVVAGLDDWADKLARVARRDDVLGDVAASLTAYVDELVERIETGRRCATWSELGPWFADALDWLLGDTTSWPSEEQVARGGLTEVVGRLTALDPFDPHPDLAALARALSSAIDIPVGRVGVLGVGVQTGLLDHARALDADTVFVVGMAEGLCPAPMAEDTLLPDSDRRRARFGELAVSTERIAEQHRALLAALAAARHETIVSLPRGDHRGGRTRVPSRWLLDLVGHRLGKRPSSDEFARLRSPDVDHVASFEAGLRRATSPTHLGERRLQALLSSHGQVGATPSLARSFEAIAARASAEFTEWDGNLTGSAIESPTSGKIMSSTGLERWAQCPARYFYHSVLGLGERDNPEELDHVSALDRGSLVHDVLDRFIREALPDPPTSERGWSETERDRLHVIATEVFDDAHQRGVTGPALRWRRDQADLRSLLDRFIIDDPRVRAGFGSVPHRSEMPFGFGDEPALSVTLPDGRTLTFRGSIDRVDLGPDGEVLVFDYKTGRAKNYAGLDTDPVLKGHKLQLPIYALAAMAATGATRAGAYYWFLENNTTRIGYVLDEQRHQRFMEVLVEIVDGIDAGQFIMNPGSFNAFFKTNDNCRYCEFDRVCLRDREDHFLAKATQAVQISPRSPLARYVALMGNPG